jgi:aquaporin Z
MTLPKLVTEFIGTLFLVLTICLVVTRSEPSPVGALAIGLALMVMVYMGGHISGAHYNPAVSLAAWMRKLLTPAELGGYWAAQLAGGIAGALAGLVLAGSPAAIAPALGLSVGQALLAEVLYSFALVLVVLNVAAAKSTQGNSYFGLAIGMTVTVAAVAIGPLSGAALNPAVGIALTVADMLRQGPWSNLWLYLVGPFIGAALAALVFGVQVRGEPEPS